MSNGNIMIIRLIFDKMSYFRKPYCHNKNKIKVKLDLSNYATKYNLKKKCNGC